MFEKILNMVKSRVSDSVGGMSEVPAEKREQAVETTTSSLMDGLKKYATGGNLTSLLSKFGGKSGAGDAAAAADTDNMASGLESGVVSSLTSKVGLDQGVAQKIASNVIPGVMSLFKKKVDDDNEPDFNLQSLLGGLSGKSSGESSGIMGMVGNFLNKKS